MEWYSFQCAGPKSALRHATRARLNPVGSAGRPSPFELFRDPTPSGSLSPPTKPTSQRAAKPPSGRQGRRAKTPTENAKSGHRRGSAHPPTPSPRFSNGPAPLLARPRGTVPHLVAYPSRPALRQPPARVPAKILGWRCLPRRWRALSNGDGNPTWRPTDRRISCSVALAPITVPRSTTLPVGRYCFSFKQQVRDSSPLHAEAAVTQRGHHEPG